MKRVFIIHGWDGYPEEGCFPWLKKELETKGYRVFNPAMPNPLNPTISTWVEFLSEQVGTPDMDAYLIGHSIGAQTILRYLETLPAGAKVAGASFLAGWVHLTDEAYETDDDKEIAKSWLQTPLDWEKIKSHSNKFTAIFSDNDPLVPLTDLEIFREKLDAKIITEHDQGHFSGSDGVTRVQSLLDSVKF